MEASTLVSIGSLLVATAAFWRFGRVRTLDLRLKTRKDAVELRISLEKLVTSIPLAVQSRTHVSAAVGHGGALDIFRSEAEADATTAAQLLTRIKDSERTGLLSSYGAHEDIAVALHELGTRVKQLQEKYSAAGAADEKLREHLRASAIARSATSAIERERAKHL
jgi:hypothetical protein